jgi:hypothetical protein
VIIRPFTPGSGWDEYLDLTMRSFGPFDESRIQASTEPIVTDGRCLGAFDGDRLIGTALYHDMVGPSDPLWWMLREQDANILDDF